MLLISIALIHKIPSLSYSSIVIHIMYVIIHLLVYLKANWKSYNVRFKDPTS